MKILARLGIVVFILLMVGCIEEKTTVTVYKTGAGTLHLYQKFNKSSAEMLFMSQNDDAAKKMTAENLMYKSLADWEGVTAWSNPSNSFKDGEFIIEATGYFDNVAELKQMAQGKTSQWFTWSKIKDGRFRFSWENRSESDKKDILGDYDTDEKVNTAKSMLDSMKGLRIEREVVLPSKVEKCSGCTIHAGRSASGVLTDADVTQAFNKIFDYRQQVAAGKLTKDDANARLVKNREKLSMNMVVTCRPGKAEQELAQFQGEFEKAKAAYAASDMAARIKAAQTNPN